MAERKATIYDYARLKKAICNKGGECYYCPLGLKKNGEKVICNDLLTDYTDKANEITLKWCDENPQKTYKDDFLKKFPNAHIYKGFPTVCRDDIYGISKECSGLRCEDCWNEVYRNEQIY